MAVGNENMDAHLSCGDSSYDERSLSTTDSEDDFYIESDGEEDSDDSTDALGMEPYQFEPIGNVDGSVDESSDEEDEEEAEWRLNNTNWCANVVRVSFASTTLLLCALQMPNIHK